MKMKFSLSRFQQFALGLLTLLIAVFAFNQSKLQGDIDEYTLMTIAFVNHQSPDIRLEDIRSAQGLMPDLAPSLQKMADGMLAGELRPSAGFYRAKNSSVYAIHFFSYSALAAVPFYVFERIGIPVLDSFLWVNLSFVFVLGWSLFLFFGEYKRASFGLILFLLCGGWAYLDWTGPEVMSAAALCSALLLYMAGRYFAACALVALASTQNPPIVFALALMPSLRFVMTYQTNQTFLSNVRNQCSLPVFFALTLGCLGVVVTMAFNWWAFGVPNIIVKLATNPALLGIERLMSFFFDLNQGMVVGVAGIWLALIVLLWCSRQEWHWWVLSAVTVLFSLALCTPALMANNWNSEANGLMRYAFWGGMPYLFLFLNWLREQKNSVNRIVILVLTVQALSSWHSLSYNYMEFSPVAKFAMRHAPSWVNPEPEIFVERSLHQDGAVFNSDRVVSFEENGVVSKTLFHAANGGVDQQLCGDGKMLGAGSQISVIGNGWRYLNGQHVCSRAKTITHQSFLETGVIQFPEGWSGVEQGGGDWNGRWSDGDVSTIVIPVQAGEQVSAIRLLGHYFGKNTRTRVSIDGRDIGWVNLANAPVIPVQTKARSLKVELKHEYPHDKLRAPDYPDGRRLSVFLQSVIIYF